MKLEQSVYAAGRLVWPVRTASDHAAGCGARNGKGCKGVALLRVKRLALYLTAEEWSKGWPVKNIEVDARVARVVVAPGRDFVQEMIADWHSPDGARLKDHCERKQNARRK